MIRRHPPGKRRLGQLLMEFAFIALILYLLLAGIIDFGRGMFAAQVIQQAVDTSARELSRTPMPPTGTLTGTNGMFAVNAAAQQVYQEKYLVVSRGQLQASGQSLTDFFADKPLLNRLLMPLMIYNAQQDIYQYPGQLIPDASQPSGFASVTIPIVQYNGDGTESIIQNIPVVEEISVNSADDPFTPVPADSPFNLLAANVPASQRGFIALRVNYPFQAAALTSYQKDTATGIQTPTVASDPGADFGPYAGPSGLGQQAALGKVVRPFRKVLSAQAIFRREIFE